MERRFLGAASQFECEMCHGRRLSGVSAPSRTLSVISLVLLLR